MSSDIQLALAQLRMNDYTSLVIVVVVGYDYFLTFSKEVTFIWQKPWTKVSTIFVIIRYLGCLFILRNFFHTESHKGYVSGFVITWARTFFLASADLAMILRVYAMYNKSRIIPGVLLVSYIAEIILLLVSASIFSTPNYNLVFVVRLPGAAACTFSNTPQMWHVVRLAAQLVPSIIVCTLAITRFARETLEMYRTTREWQPNRYLSLLAREGTFYFQAALLNTLFNSLGAMGILPSQGWIAQILVFAAEVPLFVLAPRFVMNIREVYALHGQGDIESGFGLSSTAGHVVSIGMVAFAEGELHGGEEDPVATVGEQAVGDGRMMNASELHAPDAQRSSWDCGIGSGFGLSSAQWRDVEENIEGVTD